MLDRLVGRAVLAEPDGVMGHDVDDALAHQRRQPDRRPAVIREHQERAGIRDDAAVQRHAVHGRRHGVLADAIMDEAAAVIRGAERFHALGAGVVGTGEVGRAADHFGQRRGQGFERVFRRSAACDLFRRLRQLVLRGAYRRGQLRRKARRRCGARTRRALRHRARQGAAARRAAPAHCAGRPQAIVADRRRHFERRRVPAELLPRARDFVGAERRAVALLRAGLGGRAVADDGAASDERRPVGLLRGFDGARDRRRIVAVDAARGPAGGLKALYLIDRIGQRQRAVDRDAVVVEQHDELVELEVAGERDGLLADAFHEIAVGHQRVGEVIDQIVRIPPRGGAPQAPCRPRWRGPGRAGRWWSRPRRVAVFRMSRRQRADLAEAFEFVDGQRRIAGQMQQRVEQHGAVAGGQHETVAVRPRRIGRIEFEEPREQHGGDVGRPHGQARVAGSCLLDRVHRQRPDGVGHAVVLGARNRSRSGRGKACSLGEVRARR